MKPESRTLSAASPSSETTSTSVGAPRDSRGRLIGNRNKHPRSRPFQRKSLDKHTIDQHQQNVANAARSAIAAIKSTRDQLQKAAPIYLESHKLAVALALKNKDSKALDVARKGAWEALTNISVVDPITGERVHVIDPKEDRQSNLPSITIGIALGGSPPPRSIVSTPNDHDVDQRNEPNPPARRLPPHAPFNTSASDDDEDR